MARKTEQRSDADWTGNHKDGQHHTHPVTTVTGKFKVICNRFSEGKPQSTIAKNYRVVKKTVLYVRENEESNGAWHVSNRANAAYERYQKPVLTEGAGDAPQLGKYF